MMHCNVLRDYWTIEHIVWMYVIVCVHVSVYVSISDQFLWAKERNVSFMYICNTCVDKNYNQTTHLAMQIIPYAAVNLVHYLRHTKA